MESDELTEARVHALPECNFKDIDPDDCRGDERFDFKTTDGPWAYGCNAHYEKHRLYQKLGTGMGQKLVATR